MLWLQLDCQIFTTNKNIATLFENISFMYSQKPFPLSNVFVIFMQPYHFGAKILLKFL